MGHSRPTPQNRAGTHLSRNRRPVYGNGLSGRSIHGWIDLDVSLYQTGGLSAKFLYRTKQVISLNYDVWEQIRDQVTTLEFIDHGKNIVYRVSALDAWKYGSTYKEQRGLSVGERFGIPLHIFAIETVAGEILQEKREVTTIPPSSMSTQPLQARLL